jgi:hypothetical protein
MELLFRIGSIRYGSSNGCSRLLDSRGQGETYGFVTYFKINFIRLQNLASSARIQVGQQEEKTSLY